MSRAKKSRSRPVREDDLETLAAKRDAVRAAVPGPLVVEAREVDGARRLVTIGPDHWIWKPIPPEGATAETAFTTGPGFKPAIVRFDNVIARVIPPPDATDEQVEEVRTKMLVEAAAVRVLPRRRAGVVTEAPRAPERSAHKRAREIVGAMIDEANTADRVALRAFAEEVMGRANL
jgi:hypothetical protein